MKLTDPPTVDELMKLSKSFGNFQRQRRRRERERQWLKDHGFTSWESLHTKLMKGTLILKSGKKEAKQV